MKFYQYYEMMNEGRLSRFLGKAALATGLAIGGVHLAGHNPNLPANTQSQPTSITPYESPFEDTPDKADLAIFDDEEEKPLLALPSTTPAQKPTSVSDEMLNFIKKYEGFYQKPYYDSGGTLTVGYGFTKDDIPSLNHSFRMTEEEASAFLEKRLSEYYSKVVLENVKYKINNNQLIALTSFVYNVGETAFKRSSVLRKINQGDFEGAAQSFNKWKYINGERSRGLEKRRKEESNLFLAKT